MLLVSRTIFYSTVATLKCSKRLFRYTNVAYSTSTASHNTGNEDHTKSASSAQPVCERNLSCFVKFQFVTPSSYKIRGREYGTDSLTNITPRVIEFTQRRLLHEKGSALRLLRKRIEDYFNQTYRSRTKTCVL
jgi:hypothetical protein